MAQNIFSSAIFLNVLSTLIAAAVLLMLFFIINAILTRKVEDIHKAQRIKTRLFYIIIVVFILALARIWVEGFTQLVAVLGLVSAALVITNKEVIMNFTGWLIIIWRALFSEEDLIEIQQYKGYVQNIRVLYFTLLEIEKGSNNIITGRVIRIPNGLVINNAVINFSPAHLLEQHFTVLFDRKTDLTLAKSMLQEIVDTTLRDFYREKREYTKTFLERRSRTVASMIHLQSVVTTKVKYDVPAGTLLTARYYCYANDQESIEEQMWEKLFKCLKNSSQVKLASSS